MICFSGTFSGYSIPLNYERLHLREYKLFRTDNLNDSKNSIVGIYYKKFLAVRSVEVKNLSECVTFEFSIKRKGRYMISLYRLPS